MKFTIFNKQTEAILRWGSCHESDFDLQVTNENEDIISGHPSDPNLEIVRNWEFIRKPQAEIDVEEQKIAGLKQDAEREQLIRNRMNDIVKEMAINALRDDGLI